MEQTMAQITQSGVKNANFDSQIYMVDGCKVKVNFLSGNVKNDKQPILNNIRKILLAPNFEK